MPPPTSTSVSSGKDDTTRVVCHQSGDKEKPLEVRTSHFLRPESKRGVGRRTRFDPEAGTTRIQCASYAKEMLSNGIIGNHAIGITADSGVIGFQYYSKYFFFFVVGSKRRVSGPIMSGNCWFNEDIHNRKNSSTK
ncbi:hypothetical protein GGU11DRAFT_791130, partial [Lentinula aff. detonsa]